MRFINLFLKKTNPKKNKEEPQKPVIVAPFPFEVEPKKLRDLSERQYESLYERFERACEDFEDAVGDVENIFSAPSPYKERVNALKVACRKFDRCFAIASPYWFQDAYFMEMLQLETPNDWIEDQLSVNSNKQYPVSNAYDGYKWFNINFLRWLLEEYKNNKQILQLELDKEIRAFYNNV